jgi:hypothetical protein
VRCRVSQDPLELHAGRVSDVRGIAADVSRRLVLQLIPKTNANVVGEDRVDLAVPAQGEMYDLYFDVRATHAGACEVWIVVRQGPMPLATLRLRTRAGTAPARPQDGRQVATGSVAAASSGTSSWSRPSPSSRGSWCI